MGGQQLWDKLAGSFGLKCLPAGNTGVQMGGWFKKEINTAEDLKGLKMRIPGLGGDVMAKVGVSPVCLLYTSPSPRDATLSRMPSSA